MITDALLGFLKTCVHAVLGGLPHFAVPDWLTNTGGAVATVLGYANSLGVWFPGTLAVAVFGAVMAAWAVGFTIKVCRMALSLFTGGGGSAA